MGNEERGGAVIRHEMEARHETARASLASRYGIDSEFVGVPTLAKILGMGQTTIYGRMRSGSFFLPWRMLASTPKVSLDDLARWVCDPDAVFVTQTAREYREGKKRRADPKVLEAARAALRAIGVEL